MSKIGKADGTYNIYFLLRFNSWKVKLNLFMCSNKRPWSTYGSGGTASQVLDFGTRLEVTGQHGTGILYNNYID